MLFNDIEHLKLTYLTLTKLSHNFKLVNNVKQIFGRNVEQNVLDKRALILIDMIRKVLKGIDMGIKDVDYLFKYSISTVTQDVKDIESRLHVDIRPELLNQVVDYLSTYPLVEPINRLKEELIENLSNLELGGIANTVDNYHKFLATMNKVNNHVTNHQASKVTEEVLIEDDADIGLSKLARDRNVENTFTLKMFPALDKIFSGGLHGRKTYLVPGNTGDFKSGLMLNMGLYAQNNPENIISEEFLGGKKPLILYITHENTLTQTATRILKWYGYDTKFINGLTEYEYQKLVQECLKAKSNGIRFAMRYYGIGEISITDLKNILLEYEAAGYKVVLLIEDYTKHVTVQLTQEEISDGKMTDEKKAEMLSAISRELFTPILTACQYNRNGQAAYQDAKAKGKPDYLKALHLGYIGGSYNQTLTYESIVTVTRGIVPGTKNEFLALYSLKDRDAGANVEVDKKEDDISYVVFPFADGVGFKLSDTKWYHSVMDLNPVKSELADVFKVYNMEQEEKKKHQEAVQSAKDYLKQNGFDEDDIESFSEADLITKACHLSEVRAA